MYRIAIILGFVLAVVGLLLSFKRVKAQGRTIWSLPDSGIPGLISILLLLAFAILVVTGFLPVIFTGGPVSGLVLMLHVAAGPVFAVCLALLAVLVAARFRMRAGELNHMVKWGFWLVLLFAIPLIASAILGMFPFFGTEGQNVLLHLHGYSALLLLLSVSITYFLNKKPNQEPNKS
jgi:hypothetical protein